MKVMNVKRHTNIFTLFLTAAVVLSGCSSDFNLFDDQGADSMIGEEVIFTTQLAVKHEGNTRAHTVNEALLSRYNIINDAYTLNISRLSRAVGATGNGDTDAEKVYEPISTITGTTTNYNSEGTLQLKSANEGETPQVPFYWDTNAREYAFHAVAGSETIEEDQTEPARLLFQDRLDGYAYAPLLNEYGTPIDHLDAPNFRTSKQWYAMNKEWYSTEGFAKSEDFKKVPLFLQHQRALVTVILVAGEGMDRANLDYSTADKRIRAKINSFASSDDITPVSPMLGSLPVNYEADNQGHPAEQRTTARYEAIVNPYNFLTRPEEDKLCEISVSGQRFSFSAANDENFVKAQAGDAEAIEKMKVYDLKPGQHLTITATLSRETRKILIRAFVVDWTEEIISYICDDYGQNGEPKTIGNKKELLDFLRSSDDNAAGNVGIIAVSSIDLDEDVKDENGNTLNSDEYPAKWPADLVLNSTLNMGGATLKTSSRFLDKISSTGRIINGSIEVKKNTKIETAVCQDNEGSVNRIRVYGEKGTKGTEEKDGIVTRASMALRNSGAISLCISDINVEGKAPDGATGTVYIGGIAAESTCKDETSIAYIEDCIVNNRVGIASEKEDKVRGGGIVGLADGVVNDNTFEYGITLLQNSKSNDIYLRNIIHTKNQSSLPLNAYDNSWPTRVPNEIGDDRTHNANTRDINYLYDYVIDCQAELAALVATGSDYNQKDRKYRISNSFDVITSDDKDKAPAKCWPLMNREDGETNSTFGNVLFTLEGNNQTITLKGTQTIDYKESLNASQSTRLKSASMLFMNIMGTVQNLNVNCTESLYGIPVYDAISPYNNQSLDICAPLGYNLNGGTLSNVNVYGSEGTVVQGAIASGLVVWAFNNATINNCASMMDVKLFFSGHFGTESRRYGGGIVAAAADATISMCSYVPATNESLTTNKQTSDAIFVGGIVGGTAIKDVSGASYTPSLKIIDCSSWYTWENNSDVKNVRGGIIGRCSYLASGQATSASIGVVTNDSQGNWWMEGTKGVGQYVSTYNSDNKVLGAKNSMTPSQPIIEN